MEDRCPDERHGRDQAHQGDGHDLDRNPCLDAVDQVLAGVLAVAKVAGRGDREDAHRVGDEVRSVGPEELHHLDHPRHAVLREGTRDDRLLRVRQRHEQSPRIRHLGFDVEVRRERRRQVGDVAEAVRESDVLDEVRRVGKACLARSVVLHPEAGRTRHEVDPIPTQIGVSRAVAVVQDERARRVGDGPLDDVARKEDSAGVGLRQTGLEQPAAHLRSADFETDLGEDPLRLVDDPPDQLLVQDVQARPHEAPRVRTPGQ